jgi:putative transposase
MEVSIFNLFIIWASLRIGMEVDLSLSSERVIRELKQIISWRGKPEVIRCDNEPEYISAAVQACAQEWGSGLNIFVY